MRMLSSVQLRWFYLGNLVGLLMLSPTSPIGAGLSAGAGMSISETENWDYRELAEALSYVDSEGMVDYLALRQNRHSLDEFSRRIAKLKPEPYHSWNRNERIAFWINAYNGLTLLAIIDNYPIQASFLGSLMYPKNSIRQISGVWDSLRFTIMGKEVTLDHIEHNVLRQEFDEPRIHMALVCAAKSCPTLRQEPYSGSRLDEQLDAQTRHFLSSSLKFRINRAEKVVFLSKIFDWFGKDFVDRYGTGQAFKGHNEALRATLNFIGSYLPQSDRSFLKDTEFKISFLEYDWSLNEQDS